jgi:C4-dicarboxylate transporter DctM subunit
MFIEATIQSKAVFMITVCFILVAMGLVFETLSMVLIMVPVLLPAAMGMEIDPIWFGIFMVIMVECALITPPVGLNLYVIQSVAKTQLGEVAKGVIPFLIMMIVTVFVMYIWPDLALYIPFKL